MATQVDGFPNQERLWNAYGHAMGAALGVELVIRWSNYHVRAKKLLQNERTDPNFPAKQSKLIQNAFEGTFGQLVGQFKELNPAMNEPLFLEALDNAVDFRNRLGHKFLVHHLRNLRTEEGLDLIAIECNLYLDHFQRLERYLRENVDFDWAIFERVTQHKPDAEPHPYSDWLD